MPTNDPLTLDGGTLRNVITFQTQSDTPDEFGQPTTTFTDVLTTRAAINTPTQKELYQAGALTSQITHSITIRYPGDSVILQPGMRIAFGTKYFSVQSIDNVQARNRVCKLLVLSLNEAA